MKAEEVKGASRDPRGLGILPPLRYSRPAPAPACAGLESLATAFDLLDLPASNAHRLAAASDLLGPRTRGRSLPPHQLNAFPDRAQGAIAEQVHLDQPD